MVRGRRGEDFVLNLFQQAGIDTAIEQAYAKHDIRAELSGESFTVEVKFDEYASKSGNIAIEFYNPKTCKPSGIGITQADLWVQVLTNPLSAWATSVKRLKEYLHVNRPLRIICSGGDGNASLYLYRQDVILADVFQRIDGLTNDELHDKLTNLLRG